MKHVIINPAGDVQGILKVPCGVFLYHCIIYIQ